MKIIKIFLLLACCNAFAQQFTVSSGLSGVKTDGLHTFKLTPEFRLYADENQQGIRIYDSKGKEVPYAVSHKSKIIIDDAFNSYLKVSKSKPTDTSSAFVIENPSGKKLHEISLTIANTDAVKKYSISGSNNGKEWFGLVNNQTMDELYSPENTLVYKTLPMPLNAYHYLKIIFDDKHTLPVNVIAAQMLKEGTVYTPALDMLHPKIKTVELPKQKKTRIMLQFGHPVAINRIAFTIGQPAYFERQARILVPETIKRRKKVITTETAYETFELSSSAPNSIGLDMLENNFIIEIDNEDNQPLDVTSLRVYQVPVQLIAWLKAEETYTVKAGDPQLGKASYDLAGLSDNLPADIPAATMLPAEKITVAAKTTSTKSTPWIMWGCIATGAAIVLYFCISMVKDMKKKENQQA
jgi:hypothetical protein